MLILFTPLPPSISLVNGRVHCGQATCSRKPPGAAVHSPTFLLLFEAASLLRTEGDPDDVRKPRTDRLRKAGRAAAAGRAASRLPCRRMPDIGI